MFNEFHDFGQIVQRGKITRVNVKVVNILYTTCTGSRNVAGITIYILLCLFIV